MGKLIVIDGLDGSGKSTQIERVDAYLTEAGVAHRCISFPDYANPSSALVRQYLAGDFGASASDVNAYAASSFYAVDRYASYKQFWEKDYAAGTLIIAARYTTSNALHQMGKLPREEWDAYLAWLREYEYTQLELPRPDAVIFLDMPPEISQRLLSSRYGGDDSKKDVHERDTAYLQSCRTSALYAAQACGWDVISCGENGEPLPREVITEALLRRIRALL